MSLGRRALTILASFAILNLPEIRVRVRELHILLSECLQSIQVFDLFGRLLITQIDEVHAIIVPACGIILNRF